MARLSRCTLIGYPHQVTQRGNYDQAVFEEASDYRRYIDWLAEYRAQYHVDIWAYCLMKNHVHFVCVPKADEALARTFNTLHMKYSQYFNRKKGVIGHLWRGRFLSCILDDRSVFEEIRFIENNPVRMGYVAAAADYPWSSARSHVHGLPDPVIQDGVPFGERIPDWQSYLAGPKDEVVLDRIRHRLRTGRPAGEDGFVRGLEQETGRRMAALPRGRPRKALIIPNTPRSNT